MMRTTSAILLLAACGGEGGVPGVSPTGTVQGEVWDGVAWMQLASATLAVRAGGDAFEATSDTEGRFAIPDVPAGSALPLEVSADGYATARTWVALDDAAGDYPQSNSVAHVLAVLYPTSGIVVVRVLDDDSGDGVGAVQVIARPQPGEDGMEILAAVEGTTDTRGEARLEGIAALTTYDVATIATGYESAFATFTEGDNAEVQLWLNSNVEEE